MAGKYSHCQYIISQNEWLVKGQTGRSGKQTGEGNSVSLLDEEGGVEMTVVLEDMTGVEWGMRLLSVDWIVKWSARAKVSKQAVTPRASEDSEIAGPDRADT